MKDQYFGDVNDYRKYGVLRCLAQDASVRIGVCWMLTAGDGRTDGSLTSYASRPTQWRRFDPPLFDALASFLASGGKREVGVASRLGILPGAILFQRVLSDDRAQRHAYFEEMRRVLAAASLVFFDPDNGLEVKSKPAGRKASSKYLYWSELLDTFSAGHSVLFYQHFPRQDRGRFIQRVLADLASRLRAEVHALRTPYVAFFLAAHAKHIPSILPGLGNVSEKWTGQITVVSRLAA